MLNAGLGQVLSVTFTPTDTANYTTASTTVSIDVAQAAPAIMSWRFQNSVHTFDGGGNRYSLTPVSRTASSAKRWSG